MHSVKLLKLVFIFVLIVNPVLSKTIKIGFVTTLTTGAAVIGKDQQNAVNLAMQHMGGKMGGRDVSIIFGDDEFNPQKGKQKTEKGAIGIDCLSLFKKPLSKLKFEPKGLGLCGPGESVSAETSQKCLILASARSKVSYTEAS